MRLPPFVFIVGPKGAGKTTLSRLLAETSQRIAMASFEEPLREATLQIFFPEQLHLGIDLGSTEGRGSPLPCCNATAETFMTLLRSILRGLSPALIGDLAKRRTEYILGRSYDSVVFDDCERLEDIRPFVLAFGTDHCLMLIVERPSFPIAPTLKTFGGGFIHQIVVRNPEGKPEEMLKPLFGYARPASENQP